MKNLYKINFRHVLRGENKNDIMLYNDIMILAENYNEAESKLMRACKDVYENVRIMECEIVPCIQ